jgi:hypothetical protein
MTRARTTARNKWKNACSAQLPLFCGVVRVKIFKIPDHRTLGTKPQRRSAAQKLQAVGKIGRAAKLNRAALSSSICGTGVSPVVSFVAQASRLWSPRRRRDDGAARHDFFRGST